MIANSLSSSCQTKAYLRRLRKAYRELSARYCDYHLTLAANRNTMSAKDMTFMSLEHFRDCVRDFHKRIDTELLGTRASKRRKDLRTDGLMFVEHVGRNIHGHAAVVFAGNGQKTLEELQEMCSRHWSAVCPGGDLLVQAEFDGGPGLYVSKEMERGHYDFDQTILLSTFVSKD
ncbi:hypothetical protein [uncultured Devosia sp.]|uniref:hypothetical protein n=1 Tax=uncultured Devosia sp. TaxID=211434 RepID=UPI002598802B|nr:hypothetical protein [uncultured Devosia sp.]